MNDVIDGRFMSKDSKPAFTDYSAEILAAVRITNVNLLYNQQRLDRLAERGSTKSNLVILQSEAISIFRGNFIRMLRTNYPRSDSHSINRLKSGMNFIITLDTVNPVIESVSIEWCNNYYPANIGQIMTNLSFSLRSIGSYRYNLEALAALKEVQEKKEEKVKSGQYITSKIAAVGINNIDFNSIKRIKF